MESLDSKAVWPGWETVRLIGRGSFGAVYEIQREVFGEVERAALKVISIPQNESDVEELYVSGYDEQSVTAAFQAHLKSIINEYTLMRKMNGSANVVNCDDFSVVDHADGIGWDILIKMELLTPLFKVLPVQPTEEQVVAVGRDICRALALCRKYNIIHRDIKPQNIFVSSNGDYKLGDFGIAKTVEKTSGGTKIGTYKYMAPEVYNNKPYGPGADIYSLGLVLYWLLNERRMPFMPAPPAPVTASAEEEARLRRFRGKPLPLPLHGSQRLKAIVLKACAYRPEDRYHSAGDMLSDLEALQQGKAPAPVAAFAPGKQDAVSPSAPEDSTARVPEAEDSTALLPDPEEETALIRTPEEETALIRDPEEKTALVREERPAVLSDRTADRPPVTRPPAKKRSPILYVGIGAAVFLLVFFLGRGSGRGGDTKKPQATAAPAAVAATKATPTPKPTASPTPLEPALVELEIQDEVRVIAQGDPEHLNQIQSLSIFQIYSTSPKENEPRLYTILFEYDSSDRLVHIERFRYSLSDAHLVERWDLIYSGEALQKVLVTMPDGTTREQTAQKDPTLCSVSEFIREGGDDEFYNGVYKFFIVDPDSAYHYNSWTHHQVVEFGISEDGTFEFSLHGLFNRYASISFENGRMSLCEFRTEEILDHSSNAKIIRFERYDGSLNHTGYRIYTFKFGETKYYISGATFYDADGNVIKDYVFDQDGNLISGS